MNRSLSSILISLLVLMGSEITSCLAKVTSPPSWTKARRPSDGSPQSLGGYAYGCLQGAVKLPENGVGFKSIRRHRNRFFGHPTTIKLVKKIGVQVDQAGLKPIEIGDLSQPRGGRMKYGHKSHQSGLDIDVWFGGGARYLKRIAPRRARKVRARALKKRARDLAVFDVYHPSLIEGRSEKINAEVWSARHAQLLELAAGHSEVARIFVHFRIKEKMCALYKLRPEARETPAPLWLRKLRPWYGHHQHFHIRLNCPRDSKECDAQGPLPSGAGCEGLSWFSRIAKRKRKREEKKAERAEVKRVKALPPQARRKLRAAQAQKRAARIKKSAERESRLFQRCAHLVPSKKRSPKKRSPKKRSK